MKIALAGALMLIVVACGASQVDPDPFGAPSMRVTPSGVPAASSSAPPPTAAVSLAPRTPGPSVPPSPPSPRPAGAITLDRVAVVVTNDLRARSEPRVAADSEMWTPLLDNGQHVWVVDGPVVASGYTWYRVVPMPTTPAHEELPPTGWVAAAGKDGEPWLSGGGLSCPSEPNDVDGILSMSPVMGMACFGGEELAITGRLGRVEMICGIDVEGILFEPAWLADSCVEFVIADSDPTRGRFNAVIEPDVDTSDLDPGVAESSWLDVLVTGRFDHPAARTCHAVTGDTGTPLSLDPIDLVLSCRTEFVISDIEPHGFLP